MEMKPFLSKIAAIVLGFALSSSAEGQVSSPFTSTLQLQPSNPTRNFLEGYQSGSGALNTPLWWFDPTGELHVPGCSGCGVGGIGGPSSSTTGDFTCWNNTTGTLLADCNSFALFNLPGPLTITATGYTSSIAGVNGGFRINNSAAGGLSGNPGIGGAVSASIFIDNTNGRGNGGQALVEAFNPACNQQPLDQGGSFSSLYCIESDVVQSIGSSGSYASGPFPIGPGSDAYYASAGLNLSDNVVRPNAAYLGISADAASNTDWFAYGLSLSRIYYAGIYFGDQPGDAAGTGFKAAAIWDNSSSADVLKVGGAGTTHTSSIIDLGSAPSAGIANFVIAPSDANATLIIANGAAHNLELSVSAGNSGNVEGAFFALADNNTVKWQFEKDTANNFAILNTTTGHALFAASTADAVSVGNSGSGVNLVGTLSQNGTPGVSCAAGTVNLTNLTVINGIITHC